jgi:ABC-type sugar transport system permease subunit
MYETAFIRFETEQALAIVIVILVLNAVLTLGYIALSRRYEVAS